MADFEIVVPNMNKIAERDYLALLATNNDMRVFLEEHAVERKTFDTEQEYHDAWFKESDEENRLHNAVLAKEMQEHVYRGRLSHLATQVADEMHDRKYTTLILDLDFTILEGEFPGNKRIRPAIQALVEACHNKKFGMYVVTRNSSSEEDIRRELPGVMDKIPLGHIRQVAGIAKTPVLQSIATEANNTETGTVFIDDEYRNYVDWIGASYGTSYQKIAMHLVAEVVFDDIAFLEKLHQEVMQVAPYEMVIAKVAGSPDRGGGGGGRPPPLKGKSRDNSGFANTGGGAIGRSLNWTLRPGHRTFAFR